MHTYRGIGFTLSLAAFIWLAFPEQAHAYLDPNTSGHLLQMLIAGLVGAFFALKVYWSKFTAPIRNLFSQKKD